MRKLLLISLVMFSLPVFAQFHVGVKAGANVTKVEGKSFKDEFRSGYALGAFAEIKLSKKLYLQPELLINQYNTRLDTNYNFIELSFGRWVYQLAGRTTIRHTD
jgi:hypothetical protein